MATTTFLEICQQLASDAGISGEITSTVGQTGEFARVVNWVARATTEIEGLWFDWNFLHEFNTVTTIIGVSDYPAPPNLNLWDNEVFSIADFEQALRYIDWNEKKLDPTALVSGDPYMVTVLPSKALRFYDTPSSALSISTQFWRKPTVLVASSDEPSIPEQFRDIIVYKALQYYANYESADESKIAGIEQYEPRLQQLQSSELPGFQASGSRYTGTDIQIAVPYDQLLSDDFL